MNLENNDVPEDIINLDKLEKKEKSLEETIEINFNENANVIEPKKIEEEKVVENPYKNVTNLENNSQNIKITPDDNAERFNNEIEDDFKDIKKNNNILWVILLVLIVLSAGGFFVWKYLLLTPKQLFFNSINTYQKNIAGELEVLNQNEEYALLLENSIKKTSRVEIDSNETEGLNSVLTDFLEDLSFDITSSVDQKNKRAEFSFDANIKDEKSLSVSGYYIDSILYILSEDIFSKYISFPYEELNDMLSSEEITEEEFNYLVEVVKKSLMSSFNKDNFKKAKEEVNINGKNLKTTKVSYEFKNEEIDKVFEKILKDILKDEKALAVLAMLESTTKEEMKTNLEDLIIKVSSSDKYKERKLEITSYSKGIINQPVKINFYFYSIDKEDVETSTELDIETYEKITNIDLNSLDINIFDLVLDKTELNKTKINFSFNDSSYDGEFIIDNSKDETLYSYDFKSTPENLRINGDLKFSLTEKEKDKEYSEVIIVNLNFGTLEKVNNSIKININSDILLNEIVEEKNILNSVEISNLTEEELLNIFENTYQNPFILELFNSLMASDFASSEI